MAEARNDKDYDVVQRIEKMTRCEIRFVLVETGFLQVRNLVEPENNLYLKS